ncbi:MAG: TonB-dependent receptor [Steroidobacteraceae bacterium]
MTSYHTSLATRARLARIQWPVLALMAVTAAHVEAQETSASGAAQTPATDETQLQEVVVTAQFRRENLQATPLAISAVSAETMEAQGSQNIADVTNRIPSVTFTVGSLGGSQTPLISIRGLGQTDFNLAVEPGVGVYVDDVYFGTIYGSLLQLLDLDRVEVLRGPQGTLAGKNSEGGAIKLFSKAPDGSGGGYLEATYGAFDRRQFRGGDDWTLIPDKLFLRVSGMGDYQDGYVKRYDYQCLTGQPPVQNFNAGAVGPFSPGGTGLNFVPGSVGQEGFAACQIGADGGTNVTGLRVAARYLPTDKIDDTLSFDTTIDRSGPPASVLLQQGTIYGPGYNLLAGIPNVAANFAVPSGSYYNFATYTGLAGTPGQYAYDPVNSLNVWGLSNNLTIQLVDGLSLTSISAGRHLTQSSIVDATPSPLSLAENHWVIDYTQYSQELRLNGNAGPVEWTVGGYYFDSNAIQGGRVGLDGATAAPGGVPFFVPLDFLFNDPVHANSKAGFGNLQYHPFERLTLSGGLRYTADYKRYIYERAAPPGFAQDESPAAASVGIETSITALNVVAPPFTSTRTDYRATADYELTDDVHTYFEFATGYKGGGVNPRPYYVEQIVPFQPETVDSYEVGEKADLLDHHVRVNADVYYNKVNNMQLTLGYCPQYVPAGAPQNCYLPANVGTATIKGMELESEVRFGGLSFNASGSLTDFHYDYLDPAAGIPQTDQPPFTPRWKFDAGVQYALNLGNGGSITPRADWVYQSVEYASPQNQALNRIPPYGLTNVRVTYRDKDDLWEFSLAATNLFDKYYFTSLNGNSIASDPAQTQVAYVGAPREWQITLRRNLH